MNEGLKDKNIEDLRKLFLSKDQPDNTKFLLSLLGGAVFGKEGFVSGLAGAKIDDAGNGEMESLVLRRFLEVPELHFNRVSIVLGDKWNSPGAGIIERIEEDTDSEGNLLMTGTGWLKLKEGEYGAIAVGDICMGIFHSEISGNNATADNDDSRGNFQYAGFYTTYFTITEITGANNKQFRYQLRPASERWSQTFHPCQSMHFVCYGSFTDAGRQTSQYTTRTYARRLWKQNTWEISVANIAAQEGDLSNLSIHGLEMHGYSAYLNNVYFTGVIKQIKPDGTPVLTANERGAWVAGHYDFYDRVSHDGRIWLCVNEDGTNSEPSENNADWLLQVDRGLTGVPGKPGNDGKILYTWIRYADDANGGGISNNPTGKKFLGMAYNKESAVESNNPEDYQWSNIKGEDGIGVPGADGKTYYTWVAYSDNADGSGMYQQPNDNTRYIGIAINKDTAVEGSNPGEYTWSKFRGNDGKDGIDGIDGTSITNCGAWHTGLHVPYMGLVKMAERVFICINSAGTDNPPMWTITDKDGNRLLQTQDGGRTYGYIITGKFNTAEYELLVENGKDGRDGTDHEWIFKHTTDNVAPATPGTSQVDDYVPSGWHDDAMGVSESLPYEWACSRTKKDGVWSAFTPAALWAKFGFDGESVVMADIDNEMESVALTYEGRTAGATVLNATVGMWYGTAKLPLKAIACATPAGVTASYNVNTGVIALTVAGGVSMPERSQVRITVTAAWQGADYSRDLVFTIAGVRAGSPGADAVLYRLVPSVSSVSKRKDGTYSVASVSCTRTKSADGNTAITTDGVLKYSKDGGAEVEIQNGTAISPKDFTSSLQFVYYVDGQVVDRETVPMVVDGADGKPGTQGIPGTPGKDGKILYTWIRYADDANGGGISNNPVGKKFLGMAYNKESAVESNNPEDYQWSNIKGEDGIGVPGADGKTYYTWVAYSDNADGSGMYQQPNDNTRYIGIAINKDTAVEGSNPGDYTWSKFRGEDGKDGIDGIDGTSITNCGAWHTGLHVPYMGLTKMAERVFLCINSAGTDNPPMWTITDKDGNRLRQTQDGGRTYGYILTGEFNTAEYELLVENGKDGRDGTDHEWIFKHTTDNVAPATPATSQVDDYVPSGWHDDAIGVSESLPYEWACSRTKKDGVWSAFTPTALWAKFGFDGESVVMADIDNEMDGVALTYEGRTAGATVLNATVGMWYGTEKLPLKSIACATPAGVTASYNVNTGVIALTVAGGVSMPERSQVKITVTATWQGVYYSRDLVFTIAGVRAGSPGADAVLYRLVPSVSSVSKRKDGTYSVESVSCTRTKSADGNTAITTDGVLKYSKDGGAEVEIQNGTAISPGNFTSSLQFVYYVNGQVVDRETVPMVVDGADGIPGTQGIPGTPGKDGKILYMWVRYADDANGAGISNNPTGKKFLGMAYNKESAVESDNPEDYQWSNIKGEDGIGVPGADGKTYYTWVAYSDNADGSGMYQQPNDNTRYIGIAINKDTAVEGSNPGEYTWSKFRGNDGKDGVDGTSITNCGTWQTGKHIPYLGIVRMGNSTWQCTTLTGSDNPPMWTVTDKDGNRLLQTQDGGATYGYILTGEMNTAEYELVAQDGTDGKPGEPGEPGKDGESIKGEPGEQGIQGCILRKSEWKVGVEWRNDESLTSGTRYLDIALVRDNSLATGWQAYKCKVTHTSSASNAPGNTTYWEEFGMNTTSIFTSLIIAKDAKIDLMQGNQLLIRKDDGTVTAGLSGSQSGNKVRIWAGGSNPDNAPFRVTEAGKLIAANADITGKITAQIGKIGGFTIENGSLYWKGFDYFGQDSRSVRVGVPTDSKSGLIDIDFNAATTGRFGIRIIGSNSEGACIYASRYRSEADRSYPGIGNSYAGYFDGSVFVRETLSSELCLADKFGVITSKNADGSISYYEGVDFNFGSMIFRKGILVNKA